MIFVLSLGDLKIRFRQSIAGVGWILLQPLLTMGVFTVLFGRLMKVGSEDVPYPPFALCGLVPWTFFVHGLQKGTTSLSSNADLLTNAGFPRLVLPTAAILGAIADFLVAFGLLGVVLFAYDITPGWRVVTLPAFVAMTILAAFGAALWLSALNARYRDVVNALPFMTQTLLFLTPVAYSSLLVPEPWRPLYDLNPLAVVANGFRWALLNHGPGPGWTAVASFAALLLFTLGGLYYFRARENQLADYI